MDSGALHYRSSMLCCDDVELARVAEEFGTPAYVYSRNRIFSNFERIAGPLGRLNGLACYSVKANSNLAILKLLAASGAGFDIVSGGELARVLRAGADPARVVFSGVGKTADEIDAALAAGVLMLNVESAGELDVIESRARHRGSGRAPVSLRINPDVEADTHPYISTGQTIHKFGVPKAEALDLYRRAARSAYLQVRGVACHIGSQILEHDPFLRAVDEVLALTRDLSSEGIVVEFLDLGGGFGIRYHDEQPFAFDRFFAELERRFYGKAFRPLLEPGRSVIGDAGLLLVRVLYVKETESKRFVVVDGGMNDLLRPALYGSYHEILPVKQHDGPRSAADVVGPLCETGDFLARDRVVGDFKPGELLAIANAGAYGYVLASNYNSRPRPAEVLIEGNDLRLIRRRESVDDLMAAESGTLS
ncbi:MAG TPA: diaminopimelate decarboxylase [Terriglobia bacterium]|nr:diaminopimelate decarboxylase [Terriglobia bacterium]